MSAISGKPLPVYGNGQNVCDWLYVADRCAALRAILVGGRIGETYNNGGWGEKVNIDVVLALCTLLDTLHPCSPTVPHRELVSFVKDRPGYDRRCAIDASKVKTELGWMPSDTFDSGMARTVRWFLDNPSWIENVASGDYRQWIDTNYRARYHGWIAGQTNRGW